MNPALLQKIIAALGQSLSKAGRIGPQAISRLRAGVEEASPAVQKLLTPGGTEASRTMQSAEDIPNLVEKVLSRQAAPTFSRGLAARAEQIRATQLTEREQAAVARYQAQKHTSSDRRIMAEMRQRLGTGGKLSQEGGVAQAEAPPITGFEQSTMPGGGLGGPRKAFSGSKSGLPTSTPEGIDPEALQGLLEAYRGITRTPVTPRPIPPEAAGYRSLIPRRSYETEVPPSPGVSKE